MKKCICILLCAALAAGLFALPVFALSFRVTQDLDSAILAGGIMDLYAWVDTPDSEGFTYQWQFDAGFGQGHWYDLEDNADPYGYKGTDTYHLQFIIPITEDYVEGNGWEDIPFRCVVTAPDGESHTTSNMYMHIYSAKDLDNYLRLRQFGLFEPTLGGAKELRTADYVSYTATAQAGDRLDLLCGYSRPENDPLMNRSELRADLEIWITEGGKTVRQKETATYFPYTLGKDAVTVQYKLHYTLGIHDMGYYQTKTVKLTTTEPETLGTAVAKYDLSLLKEMYNESQKLISVPKGIQLKVHKQIGGWYQVSYGGYLGYVATSSVSYREKPAEPVISHLELTAPEPLAGNAPTYACTVNPDSAMATYMDWYDITDDFFLTGTDRFQAGHAYRLVIWLTAKTDYRFLLDGSGQVLTTAVINGNRPAFTQKAYEQDPSQVIEVTYDFAALPSQETHRCAPEPVPRVEPTCQEQGHEAYYRCACGLTYQDSRGQTPVDIAAWGVIPALAHTVSPWRTTQIFHYSVCTACGEYLYQEDHYGGTASCLEKGVCAVCGYGYLPENEDHIPENQWTACAGLYHARLCSLCGAHCDPQDHIPGPAATETAPQSCTVCGYIMAPAKDHVHSLTRVEPRSSTCLEGGIQEHYLCDGCGQRFVDPAGKSPIANLAQLLLSPLGHAPGEEWLTDGDCHWRVCSRCGYELEETKMLHEEAGGACATCGLTLGGTPAQTQPTVPAQQPTAPNTQPTAPNTQPTAPAEAPRPGKEKKSVTWFTAAMIGVVCFSASVTASVILLKKKKK